MGHRVDHIRAAAEQSCFQHLQQRVAVLDLVLLGERVKLRLDRQAQKAAIPLLCPVVGGSIDGPVVDDGQRAMAVFQAKVLREEQGGEAAVQLGTATIVTA